MKEAIAREMENIHLNHLARLIGGDTQVAAANRGFPVSAQTHPSASLPEPGRKQIG